MRGAAALLHWSWLGWRTYSGNEIEARASKTIMQTYSEGFRHLSSTYTIRCCRCLAHILLCGPVETALFCTNTEDDDHKDKHETGSNIGGNARRC